MDTHFPGNAPYTGTPARSRSYTCSRTSAVVDTERIKWAINSFEPYKSPGSDGIIPADLQRNLDLVLPWLSTIYKACLAWSYIPNQWIISEVVFIPKNGKASHTKAKDFRPISLTSFLLKPLERIIDTHIRMSIHPRHLSRSQHAYTKGRSVETALHSLVGYIENSLEYGDYTLASFLDIEGAFNNVRSTSIMQALNELDLDPSVVLFIKDLLEHRIIASSMGSATTKRLALQGTPQGGVLSPLLWNLTINRLLVKMDSLGFKTVAYADDVAVAIAGFHLNTMSERMEHALSTISKWCDDNGLNANPSKTELVLFTRRYKIPKFKPPVLKGTELVLTEKAKYLGIILDNKLSWKQNAQARTSKARTAIYICSKAIGVKWGLSPSNVNWLYEAVIKPTLFYGVSVWWKSLEKNSIRSHFDGTLRRMGLLITGALRSTATKSIFAMLNWLPADLLARKLALHSATRLNVTGEWKQRAFGHASILNTLDNIPVLLDHIIPRPVFNKRFKFQISDTPTTTPNGALTIYTDGSMRSGRVGGGVYIAEFRVRISFRLPNLCSVLQAEVAAIKRAANWLRYYKIYNRDIVIYTDSQAAIRSLIGVHTTSRLVQECRTSLNEMAEHSQITLVWVKGHGTNTGNRIADILAKKGTMLDDEHIDPFCGISLSACRKQLDTAFHDKAQNMWFNEPTCATTRMIWPTLSSARTSHLISQSRQHIRNVVHAVTGHCTFGTHARRLGLPYNDFCRSCQDEDEEETIFHLFCQCSALSDLRLETLGSRSLNSLTELASTEIRAISNFTRNCRWFDSD